jgi:hypothetical protein
MKNVTTHNVSSMVVTVLMLMTHNTMILTEKKEKIVSVQVVLPDGKVMQFVMNNVITGNAISMMVIVLNGMMKVMIIPTMVAMIWDIDNSIKYFINNE